MTTDILQNKYNGSGFNPVPKDFFSFLRKPPANHLTKDTSKLLKTAYSLLAQAERDLSLKDSRIKSLEKILTVDELTGLTNRRGFYKHFTKELDRTNRGENNGGLLVMIDLDLFKAINDNFGHQAGDEALRLVGSFLAKQIRHMDVAARLGGDEFILLLPNTSAAIAIERIQEIGEALNNLSFTWENATINIRGSLGVKEYSKDDSVESIIAEADRHMYKSKKEATTQH